MYHGRDFSSCLQKLDDLALVCRLHACKQSSVLHRARLVVVREVIELTTSESLAVSALRLVEHADTSADGLGRRLMMIITTKIIIPIMIMIKRLNFVQKFPLMSNSPDHKLFILVAQDDLLQLFEKYRLNRESFYAQRRDAIWKAFGQSVNH